MYNLSKKLYRKYNNRLTRAIFEHYADQKQAHQEAFNTFTEAMVGVYCMAVSQSIMDYLDHKVENYNDLPTFVKSSMGA